MYNALSSYIKSHKRWAACFTIEPRENTLSYATTLVDESESTGPPFSEKPNCWSRGNSFLYAVRGFDAKSCKALINDSKETLVIKLQQCMKSKKNALFVTDSLAWGSSVRAPKEHCVFEDYVFSIESPSTLIVTIRTNGYLIFMFYF